MSITVADLVAKLSLDSSDFEKNAQAAEQKSSSFGKNLAIGVAGAGLAVAGLGAVALSVAGQFDDAYDSMRIATGATGADLEKLKGTFKDVVSNVPTDFATASQAIGELGQRMGATNPALGEMSKQVLELSRLTGTDLSGNIKSTQDAFNAWGISSDQQSGKLDILFRASQQSGVAVADLAAQAAKAAPAAKELGMSFEETAALTAQLGKNGIDAGMVFNGLKKTIATLATGGTEAAKEAFQRLGDAEKEASKSATDLKDKQQALADLQQVQAGKTKLTIQDQFAMRDAMAAVKEATERQSAATTELGSANKGMAQNQLDAQTVLKNTIAEIKAAKDPIEAAGIAAQLFGTKAGPAMANQIREGKLGFEQLLGSITGGGDTIMGAGKDTQDFGEKWEMLKNRIFVALEPIVMKVFDAINAGMNLIVTAWEKFGPPLIAGFEKLPGVFDKIKVPLAAIGALIAAVLIPHFIRLGVEAIISAGKQAIAWAQAQKEAIAASIKMIANLVLQGAKWIWLGITSLASAAQMAAAWLIAMGPIAIVIAAVIGLAVLIIKNWDTIKDATVAVFNAIWGFLQGVWDKILGIISGVFNWVKDNWPLLLAIITGPIGIAVGIIIKYWDDIKAAFTAVKDWIFDRIGDIVGFFTALPGRLADAAGDVFKFIIDKATAAKDWIFDRIGDVVGFFVALPGQILGAAGDLFKFLRDKIVEARVWLHDRIWEVIGYFKDLPGNLANGAGDIFKFLRDKAEDLKNWIRDRIDDIVKFFLGIPGRIANVGRDIINKLIPDIPGAGLVEGAIKALPGVGGFFKAAGGPVKANMPYVVGERGPEWFLPDVAGMIIPNHRLPRSSPAAMGHAGGGGTTNHYEVHVHVAGSVQTERDLARAIHESLLAWNRDSGTLGFS